MPDAKETQIVEATVTGLREKLALNNSQCYAVLAPIYVEGQHKRVVQVIPGAQSPAGGPEGGQTGGYINRRLDITLTIWFRLKLDQHSKSVQMLVRESQGMLDFTKSVTDLFGNTYLGGLLTERAYYQGESATSWENIDAGVARRDVRLAMFYTCRLPTAVTM